MKEARQLREEYEIPINISGESMEDERDTLCVEHTIDTYYVASTQLSISYCLALIMN